MIAQRSLGRHCHEPVVRSRALAEFRADCARRFGEASSSETRAAYADELAFVAGWARTIGLEDPTAVSERSLALSQIALDWGHSLEALGHLPEAFAQPSFQRALQLLVHRPAHLVELGGVGLLQLRQLGFHGGAHFRQAPRIGFGQRLQLRGQRVAQRLLQRSELVRKRVDLRILRTGGFGALLEYALLESGESLRVFLPGAACALADLVAQFALGSFVGTGEGLQDVFVVGRRRLAQQQPDEQQEIQGCKGHKARKDPGFQGSSSLVFSYLRATDSTDGLSGVFASLRVR